MSKSIELSTTKSEFTVCKFENIISTDATGHSFKNGFCSICSATDQNSSALIDGTEVNNLSITEQGVLSWAKMKIASKFTLEVTTSGGAKTIEMFLEENLINNNKYSNKEIFTSLFQKYFEIYLLTCSH